MSGVIFVGGCTNRTLNQNQQDGDTRNSETMYLHAILLFASEKCVLSSSQLSLARRTEESICPPKIETEDGTPVVPAFVAVHMGRPISTWG